MNSSVKFFDPTVICTPELSGLLWISPPPPPVGVSSLPPQATTPTDRCATASNTNSARNGILVLIEGSSLSLSLFPRPGVAGSLCARARSLQREATRGQEPLHGGERQLDGHNE